MDFEQIALIIILTTLALTIFLIQVLFFIYYVHIDDYNTSIIPKLGIMISLSFLSFIGIILLFDIINSTKYSFGISSVLLWKIILVTQFSLLFVVIPFSILYYNSSELDVKSMTYYTSFPLFSFIGYMAVMAIIGTGIALLFSLSGNFKESIFVSKIQYNEIKDIAIQAGDNFNNPGVDSIDKVKYNKLKFGYQTFKFTKSFLLLGFTVFDFLGSFVFYFLFGIGLVTLPYNLLLTYINRPKAISYNQYIEQIKILNTESVNIENYGNRILNKYNKNVKGTSTPTYKSRFKFSSFFNDYGFKDFQNKYYLLVKKFRLLKEEYNQKGGNPVYYFLMLCSSLFFWIVTLFIVSLLIVTIMLFNISVNKDVNIETLKAPIEISKHQTTTGFSYFNTTLHFFFMDYLMVKTKFNENFISFILSLIYVASMFIVIQIYLINGLTNLTDLLPNFLTPFPIVIHETYSNDFLINLFFLILCSLPTVRFIVMTQLNFVGIAPISEILMWFKSDTNFMVKPWKYNVYLYGMFGVMGVTIILKMIKGIQKREDVRDIRICVSK